MGMEDRYRIDTGLAMDWRWIGHGLVKDWWYVPGLTLDLRTCKGLAMIDLLTGLGLADW